MFSFYGQIKLLFLITSVFSYEILLNTGNRTTNIPGLLLPKYEIRWSEEEVQTEDDKIKIYEEWLKTTLADIGNNGTMTEIRDRITCYPGPPLAAQSSEDILGTLPCLTIENTINRIVNETSELSDIFKSQNDKTIDWNSSLATHVLEQKRKLQSLLVVLPAETTELTNEITQLNNQMSQIASTIPSSTLKEAAKRMESLEKSQFAKKFPNPSFNWTDLFKPNLTEVATLFENYTADFHNGIHNSSDRISLIHHDPTNPSIPFPPMLNQPNGTNFSTPDLDERFLNKTTEITDFIQNISNLSIPDSNSSEIFSRNLYQILENIEKRIAETPANFKDMYVTGKITKYSPEFYEKYIKSDSPRNQDSRYNTFSNMIEKTFRYPSGLLKPELEPFYNATIMLFNQTTANETSIAPSLANFVKSINEKLQDHHTPGKGTPAVVDHKVEASTSSSSTIRTSFNGGKTISENLVSFLSRAINSDQMEKIKTKLENTLTIK